MMMMVVVVVVVVVVVQARETAPIPRLMPPFRHCETEVLVAATTAAASTGTAEVWTGVGA